VALPTTSEQAELDRRVRAAARLTDKIGQHKRRVIELARQVMPTIGDVLTQGLTRTDLVVLERYGDPRRLARTRRDRLVGLVHTTSRGHGNPEVKADGFLRAARDAIALYGDDVAVPFAAIADELVTEIRMIHALEAERDRHAERREHCYLQVDPHLLARSLPGIGPIGAPMLVAVMGDPGRFTNAAAFKSYLGLAPKASETGNTDRKGQPMSKAGNRRLRTQLFRSAEIARHQDPQLAAVYYDQMVHKGAVHTKALAVVAAKLAERAFVVMHRGVAYELRDTEGNLVTAEQAKQAIAERFTVPDEIRRHRRSKKTGGRAPHKVLEGRSSSQRSERDNTRRPSRPQAFPTTDRTSTLAST